MADTSLLERRRRLMGPAYRLFYDEPVHLVRGDGVWLYDTDGRRYLDLYNNVPHVGHCHPAVVEAISSQARQLNTHTRYLHDNVVELAERLTSKLPRGLDTVMFCCTGSEANELALRIARRATGGRGIIVCEYAYHGNTQATYEISTDSIPADEVPEHVVTVPAPDTFRGRYRGKDAAARYANHVDEALDELDGRGVRPAAFIVDTIMSSSGVVAPPDEYLRRVAETIRNAGMLFIADEVQPGFGRLGSHFWGFEKGGIAPDIVTMGKPMGNGHPLSAVATRRNLVAAFAENSSYFNTFGGNPVACAAGLAVLDVIEREGLQQNALEVGQYFLDALWRLAKIHDCIGDIRGSGLFIAVELVDARNDRTPATALTARVVNQLRNHGVLTGSIGPARNILKLRSPLVLSRENADFAIDVLAEVLP